MPKNIQIIVVRTKKTEKYNNSHMYYSAYLNDSNSKKVKVGYSLELFEKELGQEIPDIVLKQKGTYKLDKYVKNSK